LLYKSTDGGNTWVQMNDAAPPSYSRYTHVLTIHPANPATVFFGGLELHKSTNSGQAFTPTGSCTLHPDHHAVVFPDPANPLRMYDASDGGFAFSTDGGVTWTSGNTFLQITGFQSLTASPRTEHIIGGSQDNGTNMWLGTDYWEHRNDGDSASTIIDLDSANVMYDVYHDVKPRRSKNGGACCSWPGITNGLTLSDPAAFYPPFIQDPTASAGAPDPSIYPSYHRLYFGTNRLYQSALPLGSDTYYWKPGDSWAPISCPLGGTEFFTDINRSNVITAIAVAPSNPDRIYIGYYDGQIFVTDGACVDQECSNPTCWRPVGGAAKQLPSTVVTRIAVHPTDPDTAYVTFSGFNLASCAHVYKTINGGAQWSTASGPNPCTPGAPDSLPDIPANTINIFPSEPDNLVVGTDIGVFKSLNAGATWLPYNGPSLLPHRLPNVPVYELAIDEVHDQVYAGTHGRGAFVLGGNSLPFPYKLICKYCDFFILANAVINPPDEACTIQLIQQDGSIFAESPTDVQGGVLTIDTKGQLVTSKPNFYDRRPGAWACFNGACVGGVSIAELNALDNPVTEVAVMCGEQVVRTGMLSSLQDDNPTSSTLAVSGIETQAQEQTSPVGENASALNQTVFDMVASIQTEDGSVRTLCTVQVPLQAGDTSARILVRARNIFNADTICATSTLSATVQGIQPAGQPPLEDKPVDNPRLVLAAGGAVQGVQLVTSLHAAPGHATGLYFDVDSLGVPLQNTLMPMKLQFETARSGAAGGEITVVERSLLGTCSVTLRTTAGDTAADIAATLVAAFQVTGIPGPHPGCPARHTPRDVTLNDGAVLMVVASEVVIHVKDQGVGFSLAPKELFFVETLYLPLVIAP
jgi:hypothetical protein